MTPGPFPPGRVYLGWQYELRHEDPGRPPRRPVPPDPERLNPGWVAAQRREENLISRPAKQAAGSCLLLAGVVIMLGWSGWLDPALTGLGAVAFGGLAVTAAASAWRGRQAVKAAVAAETRRVTAARAAQERDLFAAQEDHARRFRAWQGRQRAFRGQASACPPRPWPTSWPPACRPAWPPEPTIRLPTTRFWAGCWRCSATGRGSAR